LDLEAIHEVVGLEGVAVDASLEGIKKQQA
jgi:hypothetical protein